MADRASISLSASVAASVGAAVCCTLPLVLVLLGMGGSWLAGLRAFEPYRPYMVVAALLALVVAYHGIFRKAADCQPSAVCAEPRLRQRRKTLFWTVAVVVIALLLSPYLIPYLV